MDKYYLITFAYRRRGATQWTYEYESTQGDIFEYIKSLIEQYPNEEYKIIYHLEITHEQYAWMRDHI